MNSTSNLDVTRSAILDEAARLMAQRGFRGTNLGDVANHFAVTRQALYYHFPKKHDILYGICEKLFDRLLSDATDIHKGLDPIDRFAAMIRAHARAIAESPSYGAVVMSEDEHLPDDLRDDIYEKRGQYFALLGHAYRAGVDGGRLKEFPTDAILRVVIAPGNWIARWFRADGKVTVEQVVTMVEETVLTGLEREKRRL